MRRRATSCEPPQEEEYLKSRAVKVRQLRDERESAVLRWSRYPQLPRTAAGQPLRGAVLARREQSTGSCGTPSRRARCARCRANARTRPAVPPETQATYRHAEPKACPDPADASRAASPVDVVSARPVEPGSGSADTARFLGDCATLTFQACCEPHKHRWPTATMEFLPTVTVVVLERLATCTSRQPVLAGSRDVAERRPSLGPASAAGRGCGLTCAHALLCVTLCAAGRGR